MDLYETQSRPASASGAGRHDGRPRPHPRPDPRLGTTFTATNELTDEERAGSLSPVFGHEPSRRDRGTRPLQQALRGGTRRRQGRSTGSVRTGPRPSNRSMRSSPVRFWGNVAVRRPICSVRIGQDHEERLWRTTAQ